MTKHAALHPALIHHILPLLAGCVRPEIPGAHAGEPQVTVHVVETAPLGP